MNISRKKQIPLIIGGLTFIIGAVDPLSNRDLLVAIPSLFAGILNLAAVRFVNRSPIRIAVMLNILNSI